MIRQLRTTAPAGQGSLAIPWLLAASAPLTVVFCLEVLGSVWWTFLVYQVGICLVAPALESLRAGRSRREHAHLLGLRGGPSPPAFALGLATALATGGFLLLTRDRFLAPERLQAVVGDWGIPPEQTVAMLAVMAVLNATAEELFWRGYLPGRTAAARPTVLLTVILPAALYTSYHVLTIGRLVGQTGAVVLMTAGVLGGGLFWGWLRRRTGSVWPALLSHGGAVVAYLTVHALLTTG